ncbi:hypothetical protein McanMca71_001142 [Microsporum canis]
MSGYQQAPSYGNFDPRWSTNQPTGYDPNMPYPPYNMNQPYMSTQGPQAVYGANLGYLPTGDPRFLHTQASYLFPQPVPNPAPAMYHRETDAPETENLSDTMDVDAREEGELSSCEEAAEQKSSNSEKHYCAQPSRSIKQNSASKSLEVNGPDPAITTPRATHDHSGKSTSAKEDIQVSPSTGKSPSQLRVLAQGALLNLAPHKIRYNELVEEGIDPTILKRLYDEIGIKITADPVNKPVQATEGLSDTSILQQRPEQPITANTPNPHTTSITQDKAATTKKDNQSTGANSSKPMERKDVIARMLAAKAAKAAPSSTAITKVTDSNPNTSSPPLPPTKMANSLNENSSQSTLTTMQSTRDEVRTKEKNKAQTELARQRMEQLKKLGLGKSTIQIPGLTSTSTSTPPAPNIPVSTTPQEPSPLSHPLPDRPPPSGKAVSTQIPGLIMTSSDSPKVDNPTLSEQIQNGYKEVAEFSRLPRKRPRASDFTDDLDDTSAKKHQAPGPRSASAEQRVIIDISDDEAMYGSDGETGGMTDTTNMSHTTNSTKPTTRDLPQLPDFPSRNYGSHRSTPVAMSNTPPNPANGLLQKNMEILAMRQRIAELEARRVKKQVTSQAQSSESSNASAAATSDETQQEAENSSSELENSQKAVNKTAECTLSRSTEPTVAASVASHHVTTPISSPSSAPLGPDSRRTGELRLKALRRKEIESGLPLLDAELLRTEQKLAEFREQEKKLLEQIAKGREGKRKLIEELESLGKETENLSMSELKETPNDIANIHSNSTNEEAQAIETTIDQNSQQSKVVPLSNANKDLSTNLPGLNEAAGELEDHSTGVDDKVSNAGNLQDEAMDDASCGNPRELREGSYSSSAMDESMGSSEDESNEESTSMAKSLSFASNGDDEMESTRDHSPTAEGVDSQNALHETTATSTSSNPDNDDEPDIVPRDESVSDGYEPPEPDISIDYNSLESPPFSPAPPQPIEQISLESQPVPEDRDMQTLTPSEQEATSMAVPEPPTNDANAPSHQFTHRFSPYRSPLHLFRAFRYHPDFADHVNGGFRSLTYSHNIDPHKPICDVEISGGVCDAPSCAFQHFRDMNLSDDKILVEMGSLREGKTPAERDEYVTGLRQIINDMRRDKVKDFSIVAQEIAAYRRRFLQDPSRVLAL